MHRLHRDSVPTPECLCDRDPGWSYSQLRGEEKEEIRQRLLDLQGGCCAYCERRTGIDRDDGHIEHFRKQADRDHLSLSWSNLFWSCNDEKTCGKRKDKCSKDAGPFGKFDYTELLDPCSDDPDAFLLFVSDGSIQAREGLSETDERRARETIRVFGLDTSSLLRRSRHDRISSHLSSLNLAKQFGADTFRQFVETLIADAHDKPHSTAVRHFLKNLIS